MKRILFCTIFLGYVFFSFAQSSQPANKLERLIKLDAGFQGFGFTYEPRLSDKITMDISAGGGGGYDIAESFITYDVFSDRPAFYFSLTPKYYYNRQKRSDKGKDQSLNAGNYIGLRLKYVTPNDGEYSDDTRNSILVNVHWGIQRALGKRWILNSHIGVGYAEDIDYSYGTIYPAVDFKISYVLSKVKK